MYKMASTLICAVTLSSETLPVGPDAGESKASETSPATASPGLCLSPKHRQGVTQEPRMSHWLNNKSGGNSQKKGVSGQQWERHKSIGRHRANKRGFFTGIATDVQWSIESAGRQQRLCNNQSLSACSCPLKSSFPLIHVTAVIGFLQVRDSILLRHHYCGNILA